MRSSTPPGQARPLLRRRPLVWRAQEFLAGWLAARGIAPGDVTVASKWGYVYTAGWQVQAESTRSRSFRRDLAARPTRAATCSATTSPVPIHSATLDSGVLDDAAVRDELARLREQRLEIGFSVSGPRQRETLERALEVGGFDAVQATWNLLERSAGRPSPRRTTTAWASSSRRARQRPPDRAAPIRSRSPPCSRSPGRRRAQRRGDRRPAQSNLRALDVE